jgi:hypothetical protein
MQAPMLIACTVYRRYIALTLIVVIADSNTAAGSQAALPRDPKQKKCE